MGKKQNFEDDGRTIANMNVEGMPWYNPGKGKNTGGSKNQDLSELTPSETRAMIGGVLKAALSIALVFIVGFTLFLLFCTEIWLR